MLALHTAVICFDAHPLWRELCGASWDWATSAHPPYGPALVRVTGPGRDHVLTTGFDDFALDDEVYGFLDEVDDLAPLLTSAHGGRDHPLLWAGRSAPGGWSPTCWATGPPRSSTRPTGCPAPCCRVGDRRRPMIDLHAHVVLESVLGAAGPYGPELDDGDEATGRPPCFRVGDVLRSSASATGAARSWTSTPGWRRWTAPASTSRCCRRTR